MITVYLSDDFSSENLSDSVVRFPETGLNGQQIREYVKNLSDKEISIATCSLYLLRELYLQKIPCLFINGNRQSNDVDSIGNIEILDRELEQSDRYHLFDMENEKKQ